MAGDEIIKNALQEREQLLERNPKLREFQKEIETILDKSGINDNRIKTIEILMRSKLMELKGLSVDQCSKIKDEVVAIMKKS